MKNNIIKINIFTVTTLIFCVLSILMGLVYFEKSFNQFFFGINWQTWHSIIIGIFTSALTSLLILSIDYWNAKRNYLDQIFCFIYFLYGKLSFFINDKDLISLIKHDIDKANNTTLHFKTISEYTNFFSAVDDKKVLVHDRFYLAKSRMNSFNVQLSDIEKDFDSVKNALRSTTLLYYQAAKKPYRSHQNKRFNKKGLF